MVQPIRQGVKPIINKKKKDAPKKRKHKEYGTSKLEERLARLE